MFSFFGFSFFLFDGIGLSWIFHLEMASEHRSKLNRRRSALKSLKRKDTIGVILLGDEKVGKTALVHRYLNDTFEEKYTRTLLFDTIIT